MTKENLQKLHRVYSICLGLVILVTGICFIVSCLNIYNSGKQPFTSESVANAFSRIAIPVYTCFIMTILGIIFDVISVADRPKCKPDKPYTAMLSKAYSIKDISQSDEDTRAKILKEQKNRKIHSIIRTVIICISSAIFLIYATNGANFHQTMITESMEKAMWILLPCVAISFAYALFTVIYNEKSIARELELLKAVPAKASIDLSHNDSTANKYTSDKTILIVRIVLLVVGVGILIYGFATGGTMDVLTKAINICTECIGLG
ncbi:MAG: hypothetical protein IJV71_03075 [Lachnospiraceae bacterium]|nr:hypothetical protein [Lachnospiraceae bacterium]